MALEICSLKSAGTFDIPGEIRERRLGTEWLERTPNARGLYFQETLRKHSNPFNHRNQTYSLSYFQES